MNVATFSPALVLLFVFALLWILMDIHFQDLTKTQKWMVPLLVLFLSVLNHVLRLYFGSAIYSKLIFLTMHLPYFVLFLRLTKCGFVKMAFVIFTAVVFMAPVIFVGNFAKRLCDDSGLGLLLSNLGTYVLVLLLAQITFRQRFNYLIKHGDTRLIWRLSVVPLLYYVYLFGAMNLDFSPLNSVGGYVVRLLPTIYVFIFYWLLLRNYKDLDEKRRQESTQAALSQQLASATEQLSLLNKAQEQTAIYQHNMRHHLTTISALLSTGNTPQAEDYIKKVKTDVEAITLKRFCENELVNLLCSSFVRKTERQGVQLTIEAKLPQLLSVSDTELCAILSNGLENAVHAVSELESTLKWIEFYCGTQANKLLIEIKNPYMGEITMRDGLPISNHEGHGYGCRSIQAIAEQNGGGCVFKSEHGVFILRVILPLLGTNNN